jgi:hypothetical protein
MGQLMLYFRLVFPFPFFSFFLFQFSLIFFFSNAIELSEMGSRESETPDDQSSILVRPDYLQLLVYISKVSGKILPLRSTLGCNL